MVNRREFIVELAAWCAVCAGNGGCAGREAPAENRTLTLTEFGRLKPGDNLFPIERLLVVADEAGYGALSLSCTHQPCALRQLTGTRGAAFECPCHGSTFDSQGAVLHGPATRDLPWFELSGDDQDRLVVNFAKTVAPNWRFKPSPAAPENPEASE